MITTNLLKPFCRLAKQSFAGVLLIPVAAFAIQPAVIKLPAGVKTAEIQRALNSLPTNGGEVVLPPGKIELRETIVLGRDGQILRGAGDATILFVADDANCPAIIMGEPVNRPRQIRNLRVSNVFIDGNRAHQQRECWKLHGEEGCEIRNNGITVQNVTDSTIENVTTARCRSGGLVTTANTRRLTVRGLNSFDNEFDGLACYLTTGSVFTNLYLHDNPGAGISLDLAFDDNVIAHAVLAANDLGIFMRDSRNNQFNDIAIRDSRHFGVFMAQAHKPAASGWQAAPETECTNNSFTDLIAEKCGGAAFRINDATCTNNFVSGAKFSGDIHAQLSMALPGLLMVK